MRSKRLLWDFYVYCWNEFREEYEQEAQIREKKKNRNKNNELKVAQHICSSMYSIKLTEVRFSYFYLRTNITVTSLRLPFRIAFVRT